MFSCSAFRQSAGQALIVVFILAAWSGLSAGPERQVTLIFSGSVGGSFEPCGCDAGPTGGLSRRSGYTKQLVGRSPGTIIQVDSGGYFMPLGPHALKINSLMFDSLSFLPLDVLNLSPEDLFLWPQLSNGRFPTQVISSNLTPLDPTVKTPERYALIEADAPGSGSGAPLRLAFLGLSDPARVKPNSRFRADDPLEAVQRLAPELRQQADYWIVLADFLRPLGELPESLPIYQVAARHPEVIAVLVNERRFLFHDPIQVNQAVILSSVERGRYLGQLTLTLDSAGRVVEYAPSTVEMKEGVAEVPEILERQKQLSRRLWTDGN